MVSEKEFYCLKFRAPIWTVFWIFGFFFYYMIFDSLIVVFRLNKWLPFQPQIISFIAFLIMMIMTGYGLCANRRTALKRVDWLVYSRIGFVRQIRRDFPFVMLHFYHLRQILKDKNKGLYVFFATQINELSDVVGIYVKTTTPVDRGVVNEIEAAFKIKLKSIMTGSEGTLLLFKQTKKAAYRRRYTFFLLGSGLLELTPERVTQLYAQMATIRKLC